MTFPKGQWTTERHAYEPNQAKGRDRLTKQRPCLHCDRFPNSYLHREGQPLPESEKTP